MFECACEARDYANPTELEDAVMEVYQSAVV